MGLVRVSHNLNLTMDMIRDYPEKDWYFRLLSHNPNLTMDIINDWPGISHNPLNHSNKYNHMIHLNLMAFRIQCHWRKCYYDPSFLIYRNRLLNEYNSLRSERIDVFYKYRSRASQFNMSLINNLKVLPI